MRPGPTVQAIARQPGAGLAIAIDADSPGRPGVEIIDQPQPGRRRRNGPPSPSIGRITRPTHPDPMMPLVAPAPTVRFGLVGRGPIRFKEGVMVVVEVLGMIVMVGHRVSFFVRRLRW